MFWPWRRAGGGEWLPKACNRKVRKVWAAGQSHNTELFQQHPEVLDATPRIALMTPGRREMKGKPHFSPYGANGHHRLDENHFHMGASREDWLNKEATGGPLVERLGGRSNVERIKGKYS